MFETQDIFFVIKFLVRIFLGRSNFFSFNLPLRECIFVLRPPPPPPIMPRKFSNGPSLISNDMQ